MQGPMGAIMPAARCWAKASAAAARRGVATFAIRAPEAEQMMFWEQQQPPQSQVGRLVCLLVVDLVCYMLSLVTDTCFHLLLKAACIPLHSAVLYCHLAAAACRHSSDRSPPAVADSPHGLSQDAGSCYAGALL